MVLLKQGKENFEKVGTGQMYRMPWELKKQKMTRLLGLLKTVLVYVCCSSTVVVKMFWFCVHYMIILKMMLEEWICY